MREDTPFYRAVTVLLWLLGLAIVAAVTVAVARQAR
jgi:hypothetical protein